MKKDTAGKIKEKGNLKRVFKEFGIIKYGIILGAVLAALSTACQLISPQILGGVIDNFNDFWTDKQNGIQPGYELLSQILTPLLTLLAVFVCYFIFDYLKILTMTHFVSKHFTPSMRIRISDKISRLSVGFVDRTKPGYVLSVMTSDVSVFGNSIYAFFDQALLGIIKISAILVIVFITEWTMGLIILSLPVILMLAGFIVVAKAHTYYEKMYDENAKLSTCVEETFGNMETVKAFNRQTQMSEKHDEINERLKNVSVKANSAGMNLGPVFGFVNAVIFVVICLLGGYLIIDGSNGMTIGSLVGIIFYLQILQGPIEQLGNALNNVQQLRASSKRIFALLDEPELTETTQKISFKQGDVKFDNVNFSYDSDKPLIENLNLDIKSGQKAAIVGPTGGGKTTIVNLLMRFYDPQSGKILIDGTDISTVSRESVRNLFALVLQDTWLFHGTIYENIAYSKSDATRDQVIDAAKRARCDHFINLFEKGYDSIIDQTAQNISGGQKQLLTIARAILADKPLLILDEATSNVDTRTESLIQNAMDELMKGKTCFIIAHRLSTIINADTIIVINEGNIIEQGTHENLLAQKGFYYDLFNSQYNI